MLKTLLKDLASQFIFTEKWLKIIENTNTLVKMYNGFPLRVETCYESVRSSS